MIQSVSKSLAELVRERRTLERREQRLAGRQRVLMRDLGRLLLGIGYELSPIRGTRVRGRSESGAAKRLKCPKCDRRFAHPLPMARHLRATHGMRSGKRVRKNRQRRGA